LKVAILALHSINLINAALVPSPLKLGIEEGVDYFRYRVLQLFLTGSQAKDIGVVVLAGAAGVKNIVAQGGPDSLNLIGSDAHTDTGIADQDTAFKATPGHPLAHLTSKIGKIYRLGVITAEVLKLMPRFLKQVDNSSTPLWSAPIAIRIS
jgi:hypothetical protein